MLYSTSPITKTMNHTMKQLIQEFLAGWPEVDFEVHLRFQAPGLRQGSPQLI